MGDRQSSFASGIISPSLYGRSEAGFYGSAARTILNFFVHPHGNLLNRPGALYVDGVDGPCRLIPMLRTDGVLYILAFTHLDLHVYRLPTQPTTQGNTGWFTLGEWEDTVSRGTVSPYTEDEIATIDYAQNGDTLYLAHANHPLAVATRGGTGWLLNDVDFDVAEFPVEGALYEPLYYFDSPRGRAKAGDADHPSVAWDYQFTRIIKRDDGTLYETLPITLTKYLDGVADTVAGSYPAASVITFAGSEAGLWPVYADWPQEFDLRAQRDDPILSTGETVWATRIYRGREGWMGFLAETSKKFWVDRGDDPQMSNPPPQGINPFDEFADNPKTVVFFQDRMVLGGTGERPNILLGSAVSQHTNHDPVRTPDAADPYSYNLLKDRLESIVALANKRGLLVFTGSSEWRVTGGDTDLVTPLSVHADTVTHHGSAESPKPVVADDAIFIAPSRGAQPRALIFSEEGGGYTTRDIGALVNHLFAGHTIKAWAYAEHPHQLLWVARDDGKLYSFTYARELETYAWTEHEIAGNGIVDDIAVGPEGTEDGVYLVVRRASSERTIERLSSRVVTDVRNGIFLDAAFFKGLSPHASTFELLSVTGTGVYDDLLTGTFRDADGVAFTPSNGFSLHIDPGSRVSQWGDVPEIPPGRIVVVADLGANVVQCVVRGLPMGAEMLVIGERWYYSQLYSGITGLPPVLEGREVYALLDGNVYGPYTVVAGGVSFEGIYAATMAIGLPYDCDFESLDVAQEKTRKKIVSHVRVETESSRGLKIGTSLDGTLDEAPFREVADGYLPVPIKEFAPQIPVPAAWSERGRVAIRHSAPTPLSILAIEREIVQGGK